MGIYQFLILFLFYGVSTETNSEFVNSRLLITEDSMETHRTIVKNYYEARNNWVTSNLGTYIFKRGGDKSERFREYPYESRRGVIKVLIWKHFLWLLDRHMQPYGIYNRVDPLYGCSVTNCQFSGKEDISSVDAVVVHLQHGLLPTVARRNPKQIWIFWTDESPRNTFSLSDDPPIYSELSDMFNWSMTYRSDSDVPVPFGRTVPLPYPMANNLTNDVFKTLVPYWNKKQIDVLAAIVLSACEPNRAYLLDDLKAHMKIDIIFTNCSTEDDTTRWSSSHIRPDSDITKEYLFYIVLEDSRCRQYISEKIFYHAYAKGAIPVIMATPIEDCVKLLPPFSYLHVESFESPRHLASEIIAIGKDINWLQSYHAWRNNFEVTNEHGYFGTKSSALCRLCEALNYNDRSPKVYGLDDIRMYLDPKICCPPKL